MAEFDFTQAIGEARAKYESIAKALDVDRLKADIKDLETQAAAPGLWDDPENAQKITSRLSAAESQLKRLNSASQRIDDVETLVELGHEEGDQDSLDEAQSEIGEIQKDLDQMEIQTLLDNPEFYIVDNLGTYYAAFNCKSPLFADKTPEQAACMREAFSLLIDRDYIIENVAQCGQKPANSFIPYGMADGNGGIFKTDLVEQGYFDPFAINNDYEGTVEKARTLLKAAGYKFGDDGMLSAETPISLEYLTNEATSHVKIAEAMQQDLAAIGIDMTIKQCDWNVFLQERKNGNFDFAREGWIADFNDPINMLEMWETTSGNNDMQFGR